MTLCQLTRLPPNVAGRQRVLDSNICWIFGIFLSYIPRAWFTLEFWNIRGLASSLFPRIHASREQFLGNSWINLKLILAGNLTPTHTLVSTVLCGTDFETTFLCPQGRVFFDIPLTEVPKVLELRIVDNAFVIVHVIPKIEFPKKKAGLSEKDLDPEAQKGTVVGIHTTFS